ncbi:archease [Crenobacter sp. SG2303]|uniref:Archease n=1 Tax=Crenobacter oryzisoli TaxID=3056844 RepID=A0ABT7XMV8_9NEIS|nr:MULTISPECIES: archease [unclassified Crenobacter]MDN0075122.1 archease [Crenobacter sp. SG2303]MDN0084669.1 archease [Crenobacter sp. SG2305]
MALTAHWEHFLHDADVGVRGIGSSAEIAFEQAAVALTAIVTEVEHVRANEVVEIACQAPDLELLLVEWLNRIIYEMAVRKMLFCLFRVTLQAGGLSAAIGGEPIDISRHQPAVEPKGATYTALSVRQDSDGSWLAQCVIDV